jgi:hypothetical protein
MTSGNAGHHHLRAGRRGRITDGERLTRLVLRHGHHAPPGSLLRSFKRHLRARNRSERTVGNYLENARRVEISLEGCGKQLEEATQADLEEFLGDILRRRSANTAATRYKVLRVLYRWLEEEERNSPNPMARMKPPIIPEQPIPIVPNEALRHEAWGGDLLRGGVGAARTAPEASHSLRMRDVCKREAPGGSTQ